MKVQFAQEEIQALALYLVDQLLAQQLGRADAAALRRFRAEELRAGSPTMATLEERVNADLQRVHDGSQVRQIVKPDWL